MILWIETERCGSEFYRIPPTSSTPLIFRYLIWYQSFLAYNDHDIIDILASQSRSSFNKLALGQRGAATYCDPFDLAGKDASKSLKMGKSAVFQLGFISRPTPMLQMRICFVTVSRLRLFATADLQCWKHHRYLLGCVFCKFVCGLDFCIIEVVKIWQNHWQ